MTIKLGACSATIPNFSEYSSQTFFTYRTTFQLVGTVKEQLEALTSYQLEKTSTEPETQAYYRHLHVMLSKV